MNKTELINKLLWLGYTSAEEGTEKRKEAISTAHNLVDEYLEAINYTRCCKSGSEQLVLLADWLQYNGKWSTTEQQVKDFLKEQQEQN